MRRLLPLACLLFSASSHAALLDVVATGTLTGFDDSLGLLPFSESDALQGFTLSFTFDDTTPDQSADPNNGLYIGAFQHLELRVGGQVVAPWPDQGIVVLPQAPGVRDRDWWAARTFQLVGEGSEVRESSFQLVLLSARGEPGPLASDALVPPPWPYPWSVAVIQYSILDPASPPGFGPLAQASASVTSLTVTPSVVPVPPAALLFATGLAALRVPALRRRWQPTRAASPATMPHLGSQWPPCCPCWSPASGWW